MEEIKRSRAQELKDKNELRFELNRLITTPGWKKLVGWAKVQQDNRRAIADKLVHDTAEMVDAAFHKGEISGIETFVRIPENFLKVLSSEISVLEKKAGADDYDE